MVLIRWMGDDGGRLVFLDTHTQGIHQTHPHRPQSNTEAILTQAMARALAQEVHLDERYVAEHLRDAMAGTFEA